MTWLSLLTNKWVQRGVLVLALIGAFLWYRSSLIAEGEAREQAKVAEAVAEQKAKSDDQVDKWKGQANEVDAKNQELSARLDAADKRNASLVDRMRKSTPSAKQLASVTAEACGEYAADAERSVDYCAASVKRLGETAVGASQKAWEFYDKWPAYQEFQTKLTTFQNQLKGQP